MTQAERDRLVALKKAKKKLITQKQAAEELGITERHVRRLLRALKRRGDKAVVHALRGLPSNRTISADTEEKAVAILSRPVYRGFGPTLAAEYLAKKHDVLFHSDQGRTDLDLPNFRQSTSVISIGVVVRIRPTVARLGVRDGPDTYSPPLESMYRAPAENAKSDPSSNLR